MMPSQRRLLVCQGQTAPPRRGEPLAGSSLFMVSNFSRRICMIAPDSQMTSPFNSSVGSCPLGFFSKAF